MAKIEGPILFTGSIGNLSAYKRRGSDKIILRTKGGASKDKIKNDPAFARTRDNNTEFGASSTAGTYIRGALFAIKHLADHNISGQLNALARYIMKLDTVNKEGERDIRFSQYHYLLDGFSLNRNLPFNTVIRHPVSCTLSRMSGTASLVLPNLVPGVNLYNPTQYPLYRFIMVLGVIPDMVLGPTGYHPANPVQYSAECFTTQWFAAKDPLPEQNFDIALKKFTGLEESNSLVLTIGIEFGYPVSDHLTTAVKYAGTAVILATG